MLVRIILACSAIFLLARPGATEECQQLDLEARQALIRKAPTCDKAMAQFDDCNYGASGDTALGQIVTDRCEADFLKKLSTGQKHSYRRGIKRCNDAVKADEGSLSIAIGAGCRAKLAQDYAHKFGKQP